MLVLYAEDDIEDYSLFLEVIESVRAGVDCINVINGFEALKFLEDSTILPDYIFLDVNMPTMDGKVCLKAIKRDPRFKNIPIIIYTTSRNPLDQEFCKELGVFDYVPKPNSIDEAKKSLQRILKS
ncbi:MAG: response regulator [Chryseolinea sp.]